MPRYECDQCGACCRQLIVEADDLDVLREPQLIEADPYYAGRSVDEALKLLEEPGRAVTIACGSIRPCRFLDADNRCMIYPTRPNECVAMQAGDEECQRARQLAGLPPLDPVVANSTDP